VYVKDRGGSSPARVFRFHRYFRIIPTFIPMSIADIRKDYQRAALSERDVAADPIMQFTTWFDEAVTAEVLEVNAMCLATATPDAYPSARMVLLKGVDQRGFVFYTDYRSRKGRELADNPCASLCFFWPELERQVRINGAVQRVSRTESDEYFQSRPLPSRVGAWTSSQSSVLASREVLESQLAENEQRFASGTVPLPEHWGGFRVVPEEIEFWQGRSSRLHDRIQFRKEAGQWVRRRLSP
jgi:pyridoxamine 5'-phosphate oxidase